MINKITEEANCIICGMSDYSVMLPSSYPDSINTNNLIDVYRSSSDEKLFDQLVRCKSCDLIYLSPRIKEELIINSYKKAIDKNFINQDKYRIKTFNNSMKYLIRKYDLQPSKRFKVLDIGCAGGAFPKAASDLGMSVIGIEPSTWLAEHGRKHYNLDIRSGLLEEHNLKKSSFNLVTLWDVIEHLTNPDDVISRIHHLLKNEGLLIINFPNYNSLMRKLLGFKWPFFLSVHLTYFTPKTIENFLKKNGYLMVEVRPHFQILELGYVVKRASNIFKFLKFFEFLINFFGLEKIPLKYNMGQSMIVAKKI